MYESSAVKATRKKKKNERYMQEADKSSGVMIGVRKIKSLENQ